MFYEKYKEAEITKILTIEASGIAVASSVARVFDVPMVFAKKSRSLNLSGDIYTATITSFTYQKDYRVMMSKSYINSHDNILIVDDFLATANAMLGLIDICSQAGARVSGIGICIEKGFQNGGAKLIELGYDVTSVAIIDRMTSDGEIYFTHR